MMMKTFLCVVAAALMLSTAAVAEDRDGAYGIVVLDMYAVKCMRPNDPQRWTLRRKLLQHSQAFSRAELNAAFVEVTAVLNRLGVQEFCDSTEAAVTSSP